MPELSCPSFKRTLSFFWRKFVSLPWRMMPRIFGSFNPSHSYKNFFNVKVSTCNIWNPTRGWRNTNISLGVHYGANKCNCKTDWQIFFIKSKISEYNLYLKQIYQKCPDVIRLFSNFVSSSSSVITSTLDSLFPELWWRRRLGLMFWLAVWFKCEFLLVRSCSVIKGKLRTRLAALDT